MQSTEEYLDQLLASVSDDNSTKDEQNSIGDTKSGRSLSSIEKLDDNELTEEALQKQLALLLGLEEQEDNTDSISAEILGNVEQNISEEHLGENEEEIEIPEEYFGESEKEIPTELSGKSDSDIFAELLGDGGLPDDSIEALAKALPDVESADVEESLNGETAKEAKTEEIVEALPGQENEKEEIFDLDFDGEMLLDIENVDAMLEAAANLTEDVPEDFDADKQAEDDIMSMLAQFEEESMQENTANEAVIEKAAQDAVQKALEETDETESMNPTEEEEPKKKGRKRKEKKEKAPKDKAVKEKPAKEKSDKPSLFQKVMSFMFEEDSEDGKEEEGQVELTDVADIDDLTDEKPADGGKKKTSGKKKKGKKKAKVDEPLDENAAIAAELDAEDKKKEKKKKKPVAKKKKKIIAEKTPEELAREAREARHAIGTKGIMATLLVCASLLGLILVGSFFLPKQLSLVVARTAFYTGNYEEAMIRLQGQNLNKSDQIMYEKAALLYGLNERYHQYEIYVKRDMKREALNALFQGVIASNKESILAEQLGIHSEWELCRNAFINELRDRYGLSQEDIESICTLRNPDYTVAVENIIAGRAYDEKWLMDNNGVVTTESDNELPLEENKTQDSDDTENGLNHLNPEELEHLLPEEEAIIEQMRQENNEVNSTTENSETEENSEIYSGSIQNGTVNFAD